MNEIEVLKTAIDSNTQRWGFVVSYNNASAQSLLVAQVPIWAARRWNVNLNAFRYQGGVITGGILPPDNQTSVLVRARIEYGVDAATEIVEVDYPARGCVIPVNGAIVRVYIVPPTETLTTGVTPPPMLSGFITPCDTGRGAVDSLAPTFTTVIPALTFAATTFVPIPRRACAYRIAYASHSIIGMPLNITQVAGQVGGANIAWDFGNASTIAAGEVLAEQGDYISPYRAREPIPLMPQAGALRIRNESTDTATTLAIQFLLDIS